MDVDNDLLGWVGSGIQKEIVVRVMTKAMTPTQIRRKAVEYIEKTHPLKRNTRMQGISYSNVSRVLRELAKKGIAKCTTEQRKVGRIYELTPKGIAIQEVLEKE